MDWLRQLFEHPADPLLLSGSYDLSLVVLSFLIAVFASAMAMQITAQAISVRKNSLRMLMLGSGSVALGGGVWSMHFIGMLAFTLCTEVSYHSGLTLLSMLPSVAASWVALDLISKKRISLPQLLSGGVLMGAGIGTMHYSGMAAMQMSVALRYDLPMFLLSILVAVVLAIVALWIRFGLKRFNLAPQWLTLFSSLVMGAAISGMHYTGMAAARFVPPPGFVPDNQAGEMPLVLAMGITFTTLVISSFVVAINLLLKYREVSAVAKTSESRLLAMMDTAVDGIVTINARGLIQGMNKAAEQIFGWTQAELLHKNINILTPAAIRPEHDSYLTNYLTTGTAKIIGIGRDVEAVHKDGHPIPVRLAIGHAKLPDEDIFVAFITDISQRLQMELALKENEEKFRSLIGNIPGAAYRCLYNENWEMVFISDAIENLSGYPASDFMLPSPKRSWSDLVHPDDRSTTSQLDLYQGNFSIEYRIYHKDGSVRWMLEYGEAVKSAQGEIVWLDGFLMDISQRKQMEVDLLDAKNKAEQAAESRSAFLANMSHEIRTPMNAIIGFSDLLLSSDLSAEQKKHLATIHGSAHSLLHLLNDILDSAKLEKGKLELEFSDFSLPVVLDAVVSTLWIQARKKQLELKLELDPQLGEFYYGAPDRLRQVLTNLIGNAIKFTDKGSVLVQVMPTAEQQLKFRIQDTGIGIASDRLAFIFDAFTQADASMSRRFGGTGLGTTISKQLVELMGGEIDVQSTEGVGSCFEFSLPLKAGKAIVAAQQGYVPALPALKILIADDIPQNLELLKLLLQRAGHQVMAVTDGLEAVKAVQQQPFDLVLMDIQMPHLDGLKACQQIRLWEQDQHKTTLPIIALTASVLDEDKTAAKEAGMQGFASKPIDFAALCFEIAQVLQIEVREPLSRQAQIPASDQLLNLPKALQLWGNLPTYLPQLQQFLQQQLPQLQLAIAELQAGNYQLVQQQAHAIKGVSANLGLDPLSKACAELEQASRQQQQQRAMEVVQKILLCRPKFEAEYQKLLAEQPVAQKAESTQLDNQQLNTMLDSLKQSLLRHELDDQGIEQLSQYSGEHQPVLLLLLDAVNDFDFNLALQLLEQLKQKLAEGEL
ncbi:MAG: PAS domain S-box protein [Gammaproteobacteria bacterium]|nr:PAS domain S-box protein [Gammaproteobacteria bacterium]MBU2059339.1 PAS domain S-box protein [Gammaproteobacteria bacterium]MBU2175281.1 PAS domain S-box protein [Gammaproteobacteria bacterium]MBU2247489.1 PAS domain S-box protein [Gammaproteobacteria bacterium]MBU2342580.1 PAS domain S-box protein [Gammaproteobacteria bacterium]